MRLFVGMVSVFIISILIIAAKPDEQKKKMFADTTTIRTASIDWKKSNKSLNYLFNYAEFTPENLRKLVEHLQLPDTSIVLKQSLLETGHFKGNLFVEHDNLFGLHFPSRRNTFATGWYYGDVGRKYRVSHFDDWQSAVFDLKEWIDYWDNVCQNRRIKGKNVVLSHEDYKTFLVQCNYSSAKWEYIRRLGNTDLWF